MPFSVRYRLVGEDHSAQAYLAALAELFDQKAVIAGQQADPLLALGSTQAIAYKGRQRGLEIAAYVVRQALETLQADLAEQEVATTD